MPAKRQALETLPSVVPPVICPLLNNQVSTPPVSTLRHRASAALSALKLPVPRGCQALTARPTMPALTSCPLLISQASTSPVAVFCHSTSLVKSLLKSPAPATRQAVDWLPPKIGR